MLRENPVRWGILMGDIGKDESQKRRPRLEQELDCQHNRILRCIDTRYQVSEYTQLWKDETLSHVHKRVLHCCVFPAQQ